MNHDVRLEIEGSLLERLICRAIQAGAEFAEVRRLEPRRIAVRTDPQSAEILISLCRRWFLKCTIISSGGRTQLLRRMRQRWTLALGCLLSMLLLTVFSGRLWRIEISFTGPAAALGDKSGILLALEEAKLRPGMALSEIDTKLVQKQLLAASGDYSFIGVRLQGICLLIEAAPELPSPALYNREYARDLVAGQDGVVVSLAVRSGTAAVQAGDTVRRGQLLIRGEEKKSKEETSPVSALGEVIARCWFEGSAEGDLFEEIILPTGNVRQECRLKLGSLSFPITECAPFASEEIQREILPVAGLYLPLEIERITHIETRREIRERDADQLEERLKLLARAQAAALSHAAGNKIEASSFWEECTQIGSKLRVRAVYEIYTNIAVTRDVLEEVY